MMDGACVCTFHVHAAEVQKRVSEAFLCKAVSTLNIDAFLMHSGLLPLSLFVPLSGSLFIRHYLYIFGFREAAMQLTPQHTAVRCLPTEMPPETRSQSCTALLPI